jgi:hypothetical protein
MAEGLNSTMYTYYRVRRSVPRTSDCASGFEIQNDGVRLNAVATAASARGHAWPCRIHAISREDECIPWLLRLATG